MDLAAQHHNAGRLAQAESLYRQILQAEPNQPAALHMLGLIAHQGGNNALAVELISQALAIEPDYAEAHCNLGSALQQLGRWDEVLASCHKALAIDPDHAMAHSNLGNALLELGRPDEAAASYNKALAINPDHADSHYNLGSALQELGRPDEALASYRKALAINPDHFMAHNNIGITLMELGRLDETLASYRKALAIKPDYARAHNNLGLALRESERLDEALASYRRAIAIEPGYADAHSNLGILLLELGRPDEALASYRKALAIKPDFAKAHNNLAEVLEKTNRIEDLREAISIAKRSCPGHPFLAIGEAQLLKRDGDYAAARAVLEEVREPAVADTRFVVARAHLLGELCDRLDDTGAAYNYFQEGNLRSRDTHEARRADAGRQLARIGVLAKRFTAGWVADWRAVDSSDGRPDPVFLVGFPRSGTTLLDTILRSHAAIAVAEEMPTLQNVLKVVERLPGGDPDGLAKLDPAQLTELRRTYFAELDKDLEPEDRLSAVVIDKQPLNTVEAGLIQRIFPQARFLFILRHPCDCVLSCFMQNFKISDTMANFLDLNDAARYYDKVMSLWRQYQEVLPLRVHTVRYESLVEDFEETLTPVFEFLGVGWDDGVRNYAETARRGKRITTPSYDQVTQPLYTRATGRWERYREHMQPVLPVLLPWARRFGYDEL